MINRNSRTLAKSLLLLFFSFSTNANSADMSINDIFTSNKIPQDKFFRSELVNNHIVRIFGVTNEIAYLVEGNEYAMLIDSGVGVGNIKSYAEKFTSKPIKLLLTHGHIDHIGGSSLFKDVYMNHADDVVYKEHSENSIKDGYLKMLYKDYSALLPNENIKPILIEKIKPLKDKQSFDLGNMTLQVYNEPGHTPGQVAVLLKQDKILITGDGVNQFTFLFDNNALGLTSYQQSMKRLLVNTDEKFNRIFVSHGSGELSKDTIKNIIVLCDDIKKGKSDDVAFDFMGQKAYIAKKINPQYQRFDGIDGNIVFSKEKISK